MHMCLGTLSFVVKLRHELHDGVFRTPAVLFFCFLALFAYFDEARDGKVDSEFGRRLTGEVIE